MGKNLPVDSLSALEKRRLAELEKVIESRLQSFVEIGMALAEIRDDRLWLQYATDFDGYLKKRWQTAISRRYANNLIQSAVAAKSVSGLQLTLDGPIERASESGQSIGAIAPEITITVGDDLVLNEGQSRELATIEDPNDRADCLARAVSLARVDKKTGAPLLTAGNIRAARESMAVEAHEQAALEVDALEVEPEQAAPEYISDTIGHINKTIESFARAIKQAVNDAMPKNQEVLDMLRAGGRLDEASAALIRCCAHIRDSKVVMCEACEGDGCACCADRGYLPKVDQTSQ